MQFNHIFGFKLNPRETVKSVDFLHAYGLMFGTRGLFHFKKQCYAKHQSNPATIAATSN